MIRRYGIDVVADPERLFPAMLERHAGQVRFKLSDPSYRVRAKQSLSGAAFRFGLREGLKKANREDPI
jgi:hypothetical protein